MAVTYTATELMPSFDEVLKILSAKLEYEAAQSLPTYNTWKKRNFNKAPYGIAYNVSKAKYIKTSNSKNNTSKAMPDDKALRYIIIAIAIGWDELVYQLKRTISLWGYTPEDLKQCAKDVWQVPANINTISEFCERASITISNKAKTTGVNEQLTEAVEKHNTLNPKLFTKELKLKDNVRTKMLEIIDEFVAKLRDQDIKIKIDDILFIGSNASYNYTKGSDVDLHILANAKASNYSPEVSNALYGAYRTLFNKQFDIKFFDIPVEIFVETEDTPRASNGIYSVKKNKWIKQPIAEDIPEYDKDALEALTTKWEEKFKKLEAEVKADTLKDETKVTKLLEEIYDKLRKKGIAKGEYALENLAFKELRNKGYLDKLKDYRNDLISKKLSLQERLDRQYAIEVYTELTRAALGHQPMIQDNGMFYIYNLKATEIERVMQNIRKLPFIDYVSNQESGKYDFSQMAITNLPTRYFNIRGQIKN